jgi:hypothetical protein
VITAGARVGAVDLVGQQVDRRGQSRAAGLCRGDVDHRRKSRGERVHEPVQQVAAAQQAGLRARTVEDQLPHGDLAQRATENLGQQPYRRTICRKAAGHTCVYPRPDRSM